MPATSIFIKAASSGTSGMGYSRISVLLGPTLTAASTLSATETPPFDRCRAQSRTDPRAVKRDFHAGCIGRARVLLMKSRSVREPARRSQWLGSLKMLRSFHKRPEYLQALDRVKEWTRVRFKLPQDAAILVTEVACVLPGCPPLETVVAFWTDADTRHHFKVFKPLMEVVADDLPPAWLKNALVAVEGEGLECC
jgi:nitrate reductase delta subunit